MKLRKLFILVGPSGVGKNTVMEGVIKKNPELKMVPSFTTRLARAGEKNGREYFFITKKEFRKLIKNKQLLEYEQVYPGLFYGTPRNKILELLQKNNLIKPIDVLGAQSLKKAFPQNAIIIFIKPPSLRGLKSRIKKRGELTKKQMQERLGRIPFEMKKIKMADYKVINDKLEKCVNDVTNIVRKEIKKEG
ncbi:MAG: guanylate kinase [Parcubacteria group bacterium]